MTLVPPSPGSSRLGVRLLGGVFLGQLACLIGASGLTLPHLAPGPLTARYPWALALAGLGWSLALVALLRADTSRWASWRGPTQFLTAWLVFPLLRILHDGALVQTADAHLLAGDRWLWGGQSLPERMIGVMGPAGSDALAFAYLAFFAVVLIPVGHYTWRRSSSEAPRFFAGLTAMYALGFLGYVLWPAEGPFWAFPHTFPYPPEGGALTHTLVRVVQQGITGMDTFPSLHSGITAYICGWTWLQRRWILASVLTLILSGILLATLHFAYHYGVDLVAGLTLSGVVLWSVQRMRPR